MSTAFCITCGCNQNIRMDSMRVEAEIRGTKISYIETRAVCEVCGQEVYVPEVNDENVQARETAYRIAAKRITADQIQQIMEKYHIGAGPLSQVMGFGEITINRYLNGQLPSKVNSDKLLQVLSSYKIMEGYLEAHKGDIAEVAYRKCRDALDNLSKLYSTNKIEIVTRYLLKNANEITPLALQKLLYYVQSFFFAVFGNDIFPDPCQAWPHGPVYPDVYHKYKPYGYNPIEPLDLETDTCLDELTANEVELIDAVINSFGRYSGPILEKMTHSEQPWQEARGGLLPTDRRGKKISRDTIHEYFETVVKTYHIVSPRDIVNYSTALFAKI